MGFREQIRDWRLQTDRIKAGSGPSDWYCWSLWQTLTRERDLFMQFCARLRPAVRESGEKRRTKGVCSAESGHGCSRSRVQGGVHE